jgi:DMSO/TMAO reductase YedYZ heme-binding membrane subunit
MPALKHAVLPATLLYLSLMMIILLNKGGLSFALSHTVHLFAIVALVEIAYGGDYLQLGDIAGGSVIYLFIFAMAVTSNDASVKLLGAKNWKRLHKTGSYLIWIGLFSIYF